MDRNRLRKSGWSALLSIALMAMLILTACAAPVAPAPAEEVAAEEAPAEEVAAEEAPVPCGSETAQPSDPAFLEELPPWEEWFEYVDPVGDFFLDHPLYEENFEAPGVFEELGVPPALDLMQLEFGPEGEHYMFNMVTAFAEQPEGESLAALLEPGRRTAVAGLYIDVDRNGFSDFLIATTDESPDMAVVLETNSLELVTDIEVAMDDVSIRFMVPRDLIGDRFDWVAFTGYSPLDDAVFEIPLGWVFLAPIVDIYYPMDIPVMVGFTTAYNGTGRNCQVIQTTYSTCPVQGNPTMTSIPGASSQGIQLYRVLCDGRGYALWCVDQSAFGKQVIQGSPLGWVAKCPYLCGFNDESRWDLDTDGLVDKIFHTIKDRDCGSYHDGDGDGRLDVMEHTYLYSPNKVTSCNRERDYSTQATLDYRCNSPQSPHSNLSSVPGSIP